MRDKSGKAKRIRQNENTKIVPSRSNGSPLGSWINARATADPSPDALKHVKKANGKEIWRCLQSFPYIK